MKDNIIHALEHLPPFPEAQLQIDEGCLHNVWRTVSIRYHVTGKNYTFFVNQSLKMRFI